MHTEAINHDPAITFFQTGNQNSGRPSMGAWVTYGLGSVNENLPGYVVMLDETGGPISGAKNSNATKEGQPSAPTCHLPRPTLASVFPT